MDSVSREMVDAFYAAFVSRDPERIGAIVHEDVEWTVSGPVDLMDVCGSWRGRAAVTDRFARVIPRSVAFVRLDVERLLVDGNESAMLGRIVSRHIASGRMISHRTSHFIRYRDGLAVDVRVLTDSLDAAEQYLGHSIPLGTAQRQVRDDLAEV